MAQYTNRVRVLNYYYYYYRRARQTIYAWASLYDNTIIIITIIAIIVIITIMYN